MSWLLDDSSMRELAALSKRGVLHAVAPSGARAQRTGNAFTIPVHGLLVKARTPLISAFYGGCTLYGDIVAGLEQAQMDPSVDKVVLDIDSPGGSVSGLFETLSALESCSKPIVARASSALSAAYAIASKASRIEATSVGAMFGSIGVVSSFVVDDSVVSLTSTNAPNKRPDVRTLEGKAAARAELDAIHDLFVNTIARGRKTTAQNVNANFGRGGVLLAADAQKRGMIDAVMKPGKPNAMAHGASTSEQAAAAQSLVDIVAERMLADRAHFGTRRK